MRVITHGDNGAQECDPYEQESRQFFWTDNAIVKAVAQNHIAKHHDDHGWQHDDQGELAQAKEKVVDFFHIQHT